MSLVDDPAQPNATTLLIKRKGKNTDVEAVAKYIDADEELGLAWFWAFTSTEKSGEPHYDHHGDQVAADAEMVKAVMDYMQRGGAVDEMHDYEQKSRVVFAMPVTAEVAKAIGIEQTGLLVTIKCTDDQIAKLKDGTFTGVSIAGLGTRELVEACKSLSRVVKGCLVTNEVDGHQHQIEVDEDGELWCSYNTATGADYAHSHAVMRNAEGGIEILADSGHSHELAADQPAVVIVAPTDIVVVAEAVAMSRSPSKKSAPNAARASESPRHAAGANVNAQRNSTMTTKANDESDAKITDLEKQVVSLNKRADRAERIAKLSLAEKSFFDALATDAQDEFLAKSTADRGAAMAADPVEFELDGISYRKSTQGYTLAKRLRDEVEKNERAEIEKAAAQHLGNVAGEAAVHGAIIKAIRRSGESAEMQAKMLGVLSGANAIAKGRMVPAGGDGGADPLAKSATEQLDELTLEYAKSNKVDRPTARVAVMKTAEGKRLYAESIGR